MKSTTLGLATLLVASGFVQAQELKFSAIVDVW